MGGRRRHCSPALPSRTAGHRPAWPGSQASPRLPLAMRSTSPTATRASRWMATAPRLPPLRTAARCRRWACAGTAGAAVSCAPRRRRARRGASCPPVLARLAPTAPARHPPSQTASLAKTRTTARLNAARWTLKTPTAATLRSTQFATAPSTAAMPATPTPRAAPSAATASEASVGQTTCPHVAPAPPPSATIVATDLSLTLPLTRTQSQLTRRP